MKKKKKQAYRGSPCRCKASGASLALQFRRCGRGVHRNCDQAFRGRRARNCSNHNAEAKMRC